MVMTISVSIDANIIVISITQESLDVVLKSINSSCHYPSKEDINFLYYRLLIVCMTGMITFMIWLKKGAVQVGKDQEKAQSERDVERKCRF